MAFIPFSNDYGLLNKDVIVVDCSHSAADQLTHHLKGAQKSLMDLTLRGDSSTDSVLNAIITGNSSIEKKHVSSNHFDIDSFLSVWCCLNKNIAYKFRQIICECAIIGDFRELALHYDWQYTSLKLACWLNSEEKRLFYRPYEAAINSEAGEENGITKFLYFLPIFERVLMDPDLFEFRNQWRDEYETVVNGFKIIHDPAVTCISKFSEIGLVVIQTPEPLHYYSLFSATRGYDVVLACYNENRYELEIKYTCHVDIFSRPTLPKLDMRPLAAYLNRREKQLIIASNKSLYNTNDIDVQWSANSVTDSGPMLRLDRESQKLTKSERYGHPYERPIFSSFITKTEFIWIVISYFKFAYLSSSSRGIDASYVKPKKDWEWSEIHEFNRSIDWSLWSI